MPSNAPMAMPTDGRTTHGLPSPAGPGRTSGRRRAGSESRSEGNSRSAWRVSPGAPSEVNLGYVGNPGKPSARSGLRYHRLADGMACRAGGKISDSPCSARAKLGPRPPDANRIAARWIPAAVIVLGAFAAAAFGQYPGSIRSVSPAVPSGSDIPTSSSPPRASELPPLLPAPQCPVELSAPCYPVPTEYHPHHVYLPDQSLDWATGGCEGECRPCRPAWVSAEFFFGCVKDLDDVSRGFAYGVRLGGGYWFSDAKTTGLDLSFLNTHDTYREVNLDGSMTTSPVTATAVDVNLRQELLTYEKVRVDGLVGYQYVQLHEKVTVFTPLFLADVSARNEVHAAQFGVVANYRIGSYFSEVVGKLAVGHNSGSITVNGVRMNDGGLCWLPEFGLRCGYQLGEGCWATMGYTLLYLSNVERPGKGETDFFLHGLLFGIERRF